MLTLVGSLAGILGGYASAVWLQGEPGGIYMANVWALTNTMDLVGGLLKAIVFGLIIGLTACYCGFYATGGAAGVGRAVNDTVVLAATLEADGACSKTEWTADALVPAPISESGSEWSAQEVRDAILLEIAAAFLSHEEWPRSGGASRLVVPFMFD